MATTHAHAVAAGYTHAIVAILEQDDCDSQTDYYNAKTTREVVIAYSKHGRDLFSEMRKAAALFPETAHLADDDASLEHRQKYSMGRGYFLKAGGTWSSGWKVKKQSLNYCDTPVVLGYLLEGAR